MSTFGQIYCQTNSIVPDVTHYPSPAINSNTNHHEFFGYLLLSQIETVESVVQLENKFGVASKRSDSLEKSVEYLQNKCCLLEQSIEKLMNLFLESRKPEPLLSKFQKKDVESSTGRALDTCSFKKSEPILVDCKLVKENIQEQNFSPSLTQEHDLVGDCYHCTNCKPRLNPLEQDIKEIQRLFNKRVKYEVNRKFGKSFLAEHQVRELDFKEMHKIKRKVVRLFSPFPLSVKAAWNNAMNSLRQDRHQLKKRRKSERD